MSVDSRLLTLAAIVGDGRRWVSWDAVDREVGERSGYARQMVGSGKVDELVRRLRGGSAVDVGPGAEMFRGVSGKMRVAPVFEGKVPKPAKKVERRTGWEGKVKLEPKAPGRRRWRGDE
jgi:hypothetical protein